MTLAEKIRELCIEKGETLASLERKLDFGNGTIRRWATQSPSSDKLTKVADFFMVSVDYLLDREQRAEVAEMQEPTLTEEDELDIKRELDRMLSRLSDADNPLMFDGEPLDDETRELLQASLENQVRLAKIISKKRKDPEE